MVTWILHNMTGNKYTNLIMLLSVFALFMVLVAGLSDMAINNEVIRACAGCL